MRAAISALVMAAGLLAACQSGAPHMINIYEEEDLSGSPYGEPVSVIVVTYSAGKVCYANDRTGQDTRQMYTNCQAARAAGAHILPAN